MTMVHIPGEVGGGAVQLKNSSIEMHSNTPILAPNNLVTIRRLPDI